MPIYMDVHILPGVKAKDVAEAHRRDLLHQHDFNCNCMTYWIDEARENVFCLIEAPGREAVEAMHSRAHGLVPNRIIEVKHEVVESFLGRIYDPENATESDGMKVFADPSFRVLLVTSVADPILLRVQSGMEKANELLNRHNAIVRKNIAAHTGREAEHNGSGFIVSFSSAAKAVACALAIQNQMTHADTIALGFSIGINAGEPVEKSDQLFGDTIQRAFSLCSIARPGQIAVSSSVKALLARDQAQFSQCDFVSLAPQDEQLLEQLFIILGENWQDCGFDLDNYCHAMTMSKSQLYRKCINLTGLSPNILLKAFRLEKAKELMKKQHYSIAQITFEAGFTSPSYFTKCFKKQYGLLPMAYIEQLH